MMTSIQYNPEFEKIFQFSDIVEELKASKREVKRRLGEFGLSFTMPYMLLSGTVKISKKKTSLDKIVDNILQTFDSLDERSQMQIEAKFKRATITGRQKLLPALKTIASSNALFSSKFVSEAMSAFTTIENASLIFTSKVYPNKIDPATDPAMFKRLQAAYKDCDLTDWQSEKRSIYDTLSNHNASI
jgi:hypothetical protein